MNSNLPSSLNESSALVRSSNELIATLGETLTTAMRSLTELEAVRGKIELEMKRLDNELQLAVAQANNDVALRQTLIPVFGQQLDRIQNRLDMAMEKALELVDGELTDDNSRRRTMVMELLAGTQANFDAMVAKMLG